MKVLLANSTCKRGGISTFMLSLRSALVSLGHSCELFFFERGPMESHLPAGCPVRFGDLAECLRVVAQGGFDIVHANNVDWPTGISAVRETGARLVITSHQARAPVWTYGWTGGSCDAYVTVSRSLRDALQPLTDLPIQVVFNGIDVHRFSPDARPSQSPPIIAWVGRGGARQKGLERFAAIAPALRQAGVRIWIVDQHPPERVEAYCPGLPERLRPLVDVWGQASFDEMPDFYRSVAASAGCVVSTSRWEGLPLALLEAQACGCPVIATDIPGTNECVLPARGGELYPEHMAPDDLAQLVVAVTSDGARMRARGREAAEYVRSTFSLERMAEHYVRVYGEAPYRWPGSIRDRLRGRLRLSPAVHWNGYVQQRWGVGHRQYQASVALAGRAERRLAAGAARASWRTSPTLYLRPRRLVHLLTTMLRARHLGHVPLHAGAESTPAGVRTPRRPSNA